MILDNFLKLFGLNPDINKLSWNEVGILGLIPAGQLYARIFKFNGSLDKWFLMFPLLLFPPLSFIPLILMKFGYVDNGNGSSPYDLIMILPIIVKFLIPFILPYFIDDRIIGIIVSFILKLLMVMICNLYRRYDNCNSITLNSIGKAGIDSVISTSVGDVVPIAMKFVPFVGFLYTILSFFPIIGDEKILNSIFWSVGFGASYILINMFNQLDMEKYCSSPFMGNIEDKVPFLSAIGVLFGAHAFNYIMS